MKLRYYTIEEMLNMIDEPNRLACFRLLVDNRSLFQKVQGSTHNHQAWPGGYFDHIQETMNIVVVLYRTLSQLRPLPFSLSDTLLVVFLHDLEKPWAFELGPDGQMQRIQGFRGKQDQQEFREAKLVEYGVALTAEQKNGMKYAEGELDDYKSTVRVAGPLAALCHMADHASARLWFNHPMENNDPWDGAQRIRG